MGATDCTYVKSISDIGYGWIQLGTDGYSWIQMGTVGYRWIQIYPNISKYI